MYPNPQDALPLPPRPDLEQYKTLAKEMLRAANDPDAGSLARWTANWMERLARLVGGSVDQLRSQCMREKVSTISDHARAQLKQKPSLTTAQFVLARAHGFASWERFTAHVRALPHPESGDSRFEQAADAIVHGKVEALRQMLRDDPDLIRRRSAREHGATLLHYVSANGVENFRQKTPPNIVEITALLLDSGAEIDAECDVYGGGATTLGLVATSCHPEDAGAQLQLLQLLLDRGAKLEQPQVNARGWTTVRTCLANGRLAAAKFLAERGGQLDLESAAGVGRLEVVRSFLDERGELLTSVAPVAVQRGFLWACQYGQLEVVRFLLAHGADLHGPLKSGATGLHWAAGGGHVEVAKLLLERGAQLEVKNIWGGTVIEHTGWAFANTRASLLPTFALLLEHGAKLQDGWLGWVERQKNRSQEERRQLQSLLQRYGAS